ncbi:flavodoxin [Desulfovibrio sp. OttesenSCG-928-C06]|nr:flavodoxin [Desulfovibrio sp. OttesenSCG-928-C06]
MASALIVYGSSTGNTEYIADMAEQILSAAGTSVKKINAASAKADSLCDGYDLILFGCSTWGDDSIELQDDFIPLFDDFEKINAKGKKTAVFGTGDSSYTYFCGAVDAISEKLEAMGAQVIDTLKIDGDPQSEKSEIESWLKKVAAA